LVGLNVSTSKLATPLHHNNADPWYFCQFPDPRFQRKMFQRPNPELSEPGERLNIAVLILEGFNTGVRLLYEGCECDCKNGIGFT
jgi:hypothetical protein